MSSEDLYSEAVEAARAGNRELAREKLEKLLETDEENVKAWLLLARVSDTYEERRICLTTVLMLDPGNIRAQELLDKLEDRIAERDVDEIIPGISRKTFNVFAAGVGAVVVIGIIVVAATIISSNRSAASRNREATQLAQMATGVAITQTQSVIDGTQTQIARVSPTPTITSTSELPPTATPTASPTGVPTLEPPPNIPGTLLGWSGFDALSIGYLPIVRYNLANGGIPENIGGDLLAQYVASADGQHIFFIQYNRDLFSQSIVEIDLAQVANPGDTPPLSNLSAIWSSPDVLQDPNMVRISSDGRFIVFTAEIITTNSTEVIYFELPSEFVETVEGADATPTPEGGVPGGLQVIRLTNDSADYSYPVISPDGSKVAAVRTVTDGDNPGTDIVLIDIASRTQVAVTNDRDAVIENTIRWNPNGQEIIYAYTTPGNSNHAIGSVAADGSGLSYVISDLPDEDQIFPILSPDGRYLAYSSNQGAIAYDLFILDITTQQRYQVTNSLRDNDFASVWIP